MTTVRELSGGDVVELAGRSATFIGCSPHPRYPLLALVVWRLDDGTISLDALSYSQEVGSVVSAPDEWLTRLERALGGRLGGLTFAELRAANMSRCGRWHPGFPDDETWTGADWSNAVGGEAGELAEAAIDVLTALAAVSKIGNTVKKLRRYETGTNTAPDVPLDVLLSAFDTEMADVVCYLDLLATKYGRDLEAAIVAKFNAVSGRQGFPERIGGRS